MPTMDRGQFSSHFLLSEDNMCVSFFSLWEFSEKMLACSILPQNGEELTRFFGDLSLQFQRPQWTGVDFQDNSFYSRIKCLFLLQAVRVFSKNADVHNIISKWRRPWPFLWCDLSFQFQRPQWTGLDFSATSFYLTIKCVFPSSVCESFLKNFDVHNFISKWRRPWPFLWGDLSFQFQCPQWTGLDFSATSFYRDDNMCVSFFNLWEFSEKMLTCSILPQNGEGTDPIFLDDLSFQFQRPQWTGVDFPGTSFYPWIKCVFLLQSVRGFSKNGDVHNFISKWRRPWPFLWGDLSFQFQCPQWTGVDFQPLPSISPIKCVFPSSVCESFLK